MRFECGEGGDLRFEGDSEIHVRRLGPGLLDGRDIAEIRLDDPLGHECVVRTVRHNWRPGDTITLEWDNYSVRFEGPVHMESVLTS